MQETAQVPRSTVEALAKVQCALYGTRCKEIPREGQFFGTAYRQADRFSYEHAMDPGDLAEIYAAIRSAQLNADFVIAAIHSHECSTGCDDDNAPRGAANFLKELARGAIDSGADMFVATGNHNLGPIEIYDSPRVASGRSSTGSAISSGATCRSCCRPTCIARNRELLEKVWKDPEKATEYDLTAPLNQQYFAHAFTFQSVIARGPVRGQPAVGNRAASRGARLRRPADDKRHSAPGRGRNGGAGESSTRS